MLIIVPQTNKYDSEVHLFRFIDIAHHWPPPFHIVLIVEITEQAEHEHILQHHNQWKCQWIIALIVEAIQRVHDDYTELDLKMHK